MDLSILECSLQHAFKFSMYGLIKEITEFCPDIQHSSRLKPFVYYATCLKVISKNNIPSFYEIKIFYAALRRLIDEYPQHYQTSIQPMKLLWFLKWLKVIHSTLNNKETGVSMYKITKLRVCMEDLEKKFADTWKNNPQNQPDGLLEMNALLSNELSYRDEICLEFISRMTKFVYPLFETCKESIQSLLPLSGIERLKKSPLKNSVLDEDNQLLSNVRDRYFYFSDMIRSDSSEKGLLLVVKLIKKTPLEDIALMTVRHPQATAGSLVDLNICEKLKNEQEIGLECSKRFDGEVQPLLKRKKLHHCKEYIEKKLPSTSRKHDISTNGEEVFEETVKEKENVESMEKCDSRVCSGGGKECEIPESDCTNQILLNKSHKSNNVEVHSKTDMKTVKDSREVSEISDEDSFLIKKLPPEDIGHKTAEHHQITPGSPTDLNSCEKLQNEQEIGLKCSRRFDSEVQPLLKRKKLNYCKEYIEKKMLSTSREHEVSTNEEEVFEEKENVDSMEQCDSIVTSNGGKECEIPESECLNQILLNKSPKSNNVEVYSKIDMKTMKDSMEVSLKVSEISDEDSFLIKKLPPEDIAHMTAGHPQTAPGILVDLNRCEKLKIEQKNELECSRRFDGEVQPLLKRKKLNHCKEYIEKKLPSTSREVFEETVNAEAFLICRTLGLSQTRQEFNNLIQMPNWPFEKQNVNKSKITNTDCLSNHEKIVETPSVDKFESNSINADYEDGILFTQEDDSERFPYELDNGINVMPVTELNEKIFNDFNI